MRSDETIWQAAGPAQDDTVPNWPYPGCIGRGRGVREIARLSKVVGQPKVSEIRRMMPSPRLLWIPDRCTGGDCCSAVADAGDDIQDGPCSRSYLAGCSGAWTPAGAQAWFLTSGPTLPFVA